MKLPKIPVSETLEKLNSFSRQPFRDKLAQLLDHSPSELAIDKLAEKSPDRYFQAVAIAARLAGYTDKLELEGTIEHVVSGMSDAELMRELSQSRDLLHNICNDDNAKSQ